MIAIVLRCSDLSSLIGEFVLLCLLFYLKDFRMLLEGGEFDRSNERKLLTKDKERRGKEIMKSNEVEVFILLDGNINAAIVAAILNCRY